MIFTTKIKSKVPITQLLHKAFGGTWVNEPFARSWWREEDDAHVCKTCSVDEWENAYSNGYYLYNKGAVSLGFDLEYKLNQIIKEKGNQ